MTTQRRGTTGVVECPPALPATACGQAPIKRRVGLDRRARKRESTWQCFAARHRRHAGEQSEKAHAHTAVVVLAWGVGSARVRSRASISECPARPRSTPVRAQRLGAGLWVRTGGLRRHGHVFGTAKPPSADPTWHRNGPVLATPLLFNCMEAVYALFEFIAMPKLT
eukprot:1913865-Alexandrium_andersonii.AAC.1